MLKTGELLSMQQKSANAKNFAYKLRLRSEICSADR